MSKYHVVNFTGAKRLGKKETKNELEKEEKESKEKPKNR